MLKMTEIERLGQTPDQVKELDLDNKETTGEVEGLTSEFIALERLSMNNVGLVTLKGFPTLPKLKELYLKDNHISGALGLLKGCDALTHLSLSGNKIKTVESLEPLVRVQTLEALDLTGCDVAAETGYREKVFKLIPHLKYLDGLDKCGKIRPSSKIEDSIESGEIHAVVEEKEASKSKVSGENKTEDTNEQTSDDDSKDDEDSEDNDIGLESLYQNNFKDEDDDDDEDFDETGEGEDEDDDTDSDDHSKDKPSVGLKRKSEQRIENTSDKRAKGDDE